MSGTRSAFLRAPATEALIVAHGQPSDPGPPEAEIACLADQVGQLLPGFRVRGVTLAMPGALDRALASCATEPAIYPLFMSDGWFTGKALPERVKGFAGRILAPLGLDPALPGLAAQSIARGVKSKGWALPDTTLILAAHGSGRSRNPAAVARNFAAKLACLLPLSAIRVGFVEESPSISEAARDAGPKSLCLPFFAAARGHVQDDVPQDLGRAGFPGDTLVPLGLHPGIPALIAAALTSADGALRPKPATEASHTRSPRAQPAAADAGKAIAR